jgi:hypothetical protein
MNAPRMKPPNALRPQSLTEPLELPDTDSWLDPQHSVAERPSRSLYGQLSGQLPRGEGERGTRPLGGGDPDPSPLLDKYGPYLTAPC